MSTVKTRTKKGEITGKSRILYILPYKIHKNGKSNFEEIFNKLGELKEIITATMTFYESNKTTSCASEEGMEATHVRKISDLSLQVQV